MLGAADLAAALAALVIDTSKANASGWISVVCPACGTPGNAPSLRVNVGNGAFRCHRCSAGSSDSLNLLQFVQNPVTPSIRSVTNRSGKSDLPPLTVAIVERYSRYLLDSPSVLADIERRRGWTADTIAKLKIGWDGSHLWIPIFDLDKNLVNARLYDPFKRTRVKSLHYANEDGLRRTSVWVPFGRESLEGHSSVWVFEGEPDATLAAQLGFPAAVITGGAGTWCDELPLVIGSKRGVFCYDLDAAGRRGARSHVARLKAMGVKALDLSFELSDPTTMNDFTDAVMTDRRDTSWFKALAKAQWGEGEPPSSKPLMRVRLGGGVPGERISVKAHVAGSSMVPLLVPQLIIARCDVQWQPDRACRSCPVGRIGGNHRVDVDPESQDLMLLCATPVKFQDSEFRRITGAPSRCPRINFEVPTMWQVQPVKLIPPMTDRSGGDSTVRSALCVSPADGRPPSVRPNQLYDFDGRTFPDVRTNESTLLSSDCIPAADDVDSFRMTDELSAALAEVFRPAQWTAESIHKSLLDEEKSLARHVTKVYGRSKLLRSLDLVYHSVLSFKYRGSVPARGWLSMGCVGDARTGKSETFESFQRYIGFGKMVMDPANTTFAGLIGGLQQMGQGDKAWVITWGLIPINDRGLVIIDELSSLSTSDIGKMSGMRSSGVAELTKIRNASTSARTRIVMSGNPRGNNVRLSSYGTAVEAFMELIGAPEDVARFDFAIGVQGGFDKEAADLRLGDQPLPADVGLRRDLVRFAWSRRVDNVQWEEGAENECAVLAKKMVEKYDMSIPLVEPSEQDLKIARIAVASAVRTYSTLDDNSTILVRMAHVRFAAQFMQSLYDDDLAYDRFSEIRARMSLNVNEAIKMVRSIQKDYNRTARALMSLRRVTVNSISLALAMGADESRVIIANLAQIGAAEFSKDDRSNNTSLVWTPKFAEVLRSLESSTQQVSEIDRSDQF